MQDKIDPLIAERAPWLFTGRPHHTVARHLLTRLLGYPKTVAIGTAVEHEPTERIMATMAQIIAQDVQVTGLDNIPRNGPAMVVANHPTGIADGIILWSVLQSVRPDLFIYANSDILRILPQMQSLILPVEWRMDKRTLAKTRETMTLTRAALDQGRLGVIFPSGRLAKRRGLRLYERDWMPSAAMIARKFDIPVVPLNIRARNSALFYLFDLIHPTLRDITLFHETLNKGRQPYRVTVGRPIPPERLPETSAEGIEMLKAETLALGQPDGRGISMIDATRKLLPKRRPAVIRG
ncbi:glycerol acyltransferase [Frigidibacter albus]|uniref:Glycerol acyltransferase n=1 Tax=Frigidibacter albus TaxID=1465486 RepID=A0A6L8VGZ9_9RHOB|nr:lysophospholipid acyltransferase family protein [Frigidibacter albus]MZQ89001.1 glycerol acyltransferase [Frigidibacter albus]NBE30942.1 glycerol acyltransferase [Frigidibacter albus]GGH51999.1 glycerol acyltransferase [Frigidibacter albus]